ncbi:cytochrome C nitrite reductase [Sphingomonas sp. AAP5]|uniref:cytochrome C nitrite reductase n=1 Tax=unclassified Sphingomonas TaxID=196159 RepID=UPI001057142D|nr:MULTISPECIES: cytochrome C nitrite reductase [unclassified Sphingomonas]MDY7524158.1 cytochrome C nitrite reductase [Sphingomonas sp. 10B4]MEB0284042.1 cytochrome C nitrite reductase [Sphingomonas sp. 10B4]QBM77067.1 cytochrome C nitrite reductase [Sphingomonas sp. AAP5]
MSRAFPLVALLLLLGGCQRYATPGETRTSGGGARAIALSSQSITLPTESVTLPASAEIVSTNCTACHSAEQILTQPRLKPEQWATEVAKMRTAYKASIAEADDPKLVAALVALQDGTAR